MESEVGVGPTSPRHMQLVVLHGIWGRKIVVEEWGHGGGVVNSSIGYREMSAYIRL